MGHSGSYVVDFIIQTPRPVGHEVNMNSFVDRENVKVN